MVKEKVINRFIVIIDPSILGYRITLTFSIRTKMLNQDIIDKLNLIGDIIYQFSVIGGVEGFSIGVRESSENKLELLLKSLKSSMLRVMVQTHSHPKAPYKFIQTDYQILKQLLLNPRIEISEISRNISISIKTVSDGTLRCKITAFCNLRSFLTPKQLRVKSCFIWKSELK